MADINLGSLGGKINKLRKEHGLTIRDLSEYTGYSIGFLSNLETGKSSPTIDCLQHISEVLETDLIDLITEEKPRHMLIRKNERSLKSFPESSITLEKLDFGYGKQVYQYLTIEPHAKQPGELSKHMFPEVCIVLSGVLTVEIEGQAYELNEGDSIYVPEKTSHRIYNTGEVPTVSYWVFQRT